jgi:predicted protein tyrosine phosphatase
MGEKRSPLHAILVDFGRLRDTLKNQGIGMTLLAGLDKLVRLLRRTPLKRFTQISPHIILGGQPSKSVVLRLIARRGVTGFINMRNEYDYAKLVDFGIARYLHLPTPDNEAPSLDHLCRGVDFIREEVARGGSVYIHCWEGLGRGPTMAAAYFVSTGCSPEVSWQQIREIRPFIRPTKLQITRLIEFADHYGQPGEVEGQQPTIEKDENNPPPVQYTTQAVEKTPM